MQISTDEADYLADPRYRSGYRYVYERKADWRVEFQHARRYVAINGFARCLDAAKWIVVYYRDRYGETWYTWLDSSKRPILGGIAGPGWQVRQIDDDEHILEVCPCGVWCRVEHYLTGRRSDVFPTQREAMRTIDLLNRYVWPMFGRKILDSSPYRTPRHVVILPARMG